MLRNSLQCTGQLSQQRIISFKMSVVLRWEALPHALQLPECHLTITGPHLLRLRNQCWVRYYYQLAFFLTLLPFLKYITVSYKCNVIQQISRTFSSWNRDIIWMATPRFPCSQPPATTMPLSASMRLTTFWASCKWSHAGFVLLWRACFIQHNVLMVHPCYSTRQNFLIKTE